jgi:hypothetical protein
MAIWGAVAGVCGYACAMTWAGGTMESVCMWSSLGGAVVDIGLTMALAKDMQSSMAGLGGLMGVGMSAYMTYTGHQAAIAGAKTAMASKAAEQAAAHGGTSTTTSQISDKAAQSAINNGTSGAQKKSIGSCFTCAIALIQAAMKGMTMAQADSTKSDALKNASAVHEQRPSQPEFAAGASDSVGGARVAGAAAVGSGNSSTAAGSSSAGDCNAIRKSGDASAFINCATAGTPELNRMMNDPRFADNFKKASGMELGDYFKSVDGKSGAQAMGMALAGLPNGAAVSAKLGEMDAEIQQKIAAAQGEQGRAYASSGGRGASHGSSSEGSEGDEIAKMMGAMMEKLNPDAGKGPQDPEMQKIEFATLGKDASQIAENRQLSLFSRVGYRYRKSMSLIEAGPWSAAVNRPSLLPPNRAIASQPN